MLLSYFLSHLKPLPHFTTGGAVTYVGGDSFAPIMYTNGNGLAWANKIILRARVQTSAEIYTGNVRAQD